MPCLPGRQAEGRFPDNPNGSLLDIAGICDPTGRIFGLMPHPEGSSPLHPASQLDIAERTQESGKENPLENEEGAGLKIFQNAYEYLEKTF